MMQRSRFNRGKNIYLQPSVHCVAFSSSLAFADERVVEKYNPF